MIEKLKPHSVEELKASLGGNFGDIFGSIITHPLPPTDEDVVDKINEIIDYLNNSEAK